MAEPHADNSLYAECLVAMAVSGDAYPCDTLAPLLQAECALPELPAAFVTADHGAP